MYSDRAWLKLEPDKFNQKWSDMAEYYLESAISIITIILSTALLRMKVRISMQI
jgi:hypothetical protein